MHKSARFAGLFAVVLAVGACSAPPAATTNPGGTTRPPATTGTTAVPSVAVSTPAAPPAAGLDACGIITPAEIEAVIESAVTAEPGGDPGDGSSYCTFSTTDGEEVLYTAYDPDGAVGLTAWKSDSQARTVPGLGDEAIYQPQIGLMVRRGQATYQFYPLADLSDEEALDLAVRLATAVSSRI